MTADTDQDKRHSATIIDFFARRYPRLRHRRHDLLELLRRRPALVIDDDEAAEAAPIRLRHWGCRPMPLSAEELQHYCRVPVDAAGAPHYRSQLAAMEAETAAAHAGHMRCFSLDDDVNALHFIARFERAGLGHLAGRYREDLADYRKRELAHGKPFAKLQPGRDYDSEALMTTMYGTPHEDRARIERYLHRHAELETAQRRRLPPRYSACELI